MCRGLKVFMNVFSSKKIVSKAIQMIILELPPQNEKQTW